MKIRLELPPHARPGVFPQRRTIAPDRRGDTSRYAGMERAGVEPYTYSILIEKYVVNDANLRRKYFPGIPTHRWQVGALTSHPFGFFGQIPHVARVGEFYVNDASHCNQSGLINLQQLLAGWELKR
ncbi:MAG: hypothetical protein IPP22_05965 [Nitrosomonas sp.]|nr:hypothetical protein [Nitrosomonas sp.]